MPPKIGTGKAAQKEEEAWGSLLKKEPEADTVPFPTGPSKVRKVSRPPPQGAAKVLICNPERGS